MRSNKTAGGIVINEHAEIVLVKRKNGDGSWLFPKGHIEEGEDDETAARREVWEETGLTDLELVDDLGIYERPSISHDGTPKEEMKSIHMYLFLTTKRSELAPTHEMEEAKWVPYRETANEIGSEKDRAWFASVFERVQEAIQRD